jgi:hypothetical protein
VIAEYFITSTHQENKMITPDQLYKVNKLYAVRKDHTNFLDSFDSKYLNRKVGIVDANAAEPKITDESVYFHRYFEELEAELTEVVKAKLAAEIAEIDLKIAVYIGEDLVVESPNGQGKPDGDEDWKLRAEEAALRNQNFKELAENLIVTATEAQENFKELAENLIVTATEAQETLKQSNLRWVRLENGNWTRRPEDTVAPIPAEEAIDEPEKKAKSVTGKWDRLDAIGLPLPVFFTEQMTIQPPSFVTLADSKPKPPTKPNSDQ